MSEWLSYGLSSFLLFSPATYYRLVERYNQDIWPAQIVFLALGAAIPGLIRRGGALQGRMVAAILVAAWGWVAWRFHLRHYASINWAAAWFAAAFAIEAAMLAWIGIVQDRLRLRMPESGVEWTALGIFALTLLAWPAIAPIVGRPWTQAEVFGAMPDPTAAATLGIALLATRRTRWLLLPIPLLWCAVSSATLLAMKSPDFPVLPLTAVLVLLLAFFGKAPP